MREKEYDVVGVGRRGRIWEDLGEGKGYDKNILYEKTVK